MGLFFSAAMKACGLLVILLVTLFTGFARASRQDEWEEISSALPTQPNTLAPKQSRLPLALSKWMTNNDLSEEQEEEDLGEGRRMFDFDPNKKESMDMYAQQILGYDKLIHDLEEKSLAATDWRAKGKLKWQIDSIKKLL